PSHPPPHSFPTRRSSDLYLLFQKMRGRGIYRTVYYLPYVTSFVAAAAVFFWVFHPQYGLINDLLGVVGIGPQRWLDEPDGIFELDRKSTRLNSSHVSISY